MNRTSALAARLLLPLLVLIAQVGTAADTDSTIDAFQRTVDMDVGDAAKVELVDGTSVVLKVVKLEETRDDLRQAVRQARVTVEVNGETALLTSANYNLPISVGGVQIDCPVTKGCVHVDKNPWALDADVRLRVWPSDSPWVRPGTFVYPVKQCWFASDTQMSNEPTFVDGGENPARKSIYYHWGLDFGGAEGLVEVVAATDGVVCSSGTEALDSLADGTPVRPRYDVVYIRDDRGWYYRYSHLHTIDQRVEPGTQVTMGQKIGLLGKEGGSGGWTHLHFDINAVQPSGRYGIVEGYAFVWQAYQAQYPTELKAVARPHHLVWAGDRVTLDATRSMGDEIVEYKWTFCDGTTASGANVVRRYDRPGEYSEILNVVDAKGRTDYDFARVLVIDPEHPDQLPPAIHAVYFPTFGLKPGDPVTFKVRSFQIGPDEGRETWDFGDGSPTIRTQSDGNANVHDPQGYAVTTHRYQKAGHYLVRVQRTNKRGVTAVAHVHVRVGRP